MIAVLDPVDASFLYSLSFHMIGYLMGMLVVERALRRQELQLVLDIIHDLRRAIDGESGSASPESTAPHSFQ